MRLTHPLFREPIRLKDERVQVLILEDPRCFRDMLRDLMLQTDGESGSFILSKNFEPLDIASSLELIIDYYHLNAGQKKIQTKLMAYLKSLTQQELDLSSAELCQQVNLFFSDVATASDYSITYLPIEDVAPLLKLGGMSLELSGESLGENLLDYMTIFNRLCRIECFCLVNLKSYMSEDELVSFYRSALGQKLRLLILESSARPIIRDYEDVLLIDADYCELSLANEVDNL